MHYQIQITNTQRPTIRQMLESHRYTDKRTDLPHKLTDDEVDSLCRFLYSCQYGTDYDERYVHQLADKVISKRLKVQPATTIKQTH